MAWYIVKQPTGHCEIVEMDAPQGNSSQKSSASDEQTWGPFESQGEAIARRVGLIRSGKCQPA